MRRHSIPSFYCDTRHFNFPFAPGPVPAHTANRPPDIDTAALAQVFEIDANGALISEIVSLYATDSRSGVDAICAMRGDGTLTDVIRLLHTLKSSSGCVGAARVVQMAGALELRARTDGTVPNAEEIEALANLVDSACVQLLRLYSDRATMQPAP